MTKEELDHWMITEMSHETGEIMSRQRYATQAEQKAFQDAWNIAADRAGRLTMDMLMHVERKEADRKMNETDTSDEAFWKWDEDNERQNWDKSFSEHALSGWQECRRRFQIRYDEAIKCWSESIDELLEDARRAITSLKDS